MADKAPKTKCTPALQDLVSKYVQGGASIPNACDAAGVSWNTVKEWFNPGMVEREPYASFVAAVNDAKARWAAGAAISITSAGKKDWRALAWMLERRNPEEWAPPAKVELTGPNGGPIETAAVRYVIQVPQEEPED